MFGFLTKMERVDSFLVIAQMLGNCANYCRARITTESFLKYSCKLRISEIYELFRASTQLIYDIW
jgi:hypothetical protein